MLNITYSHERGVLLVDTDKLARPIEVGSRSQAARLGLVITYPTISSEKLAVGIERLMDVLDFSVGKNSTHHFSDDWFDGFWSAL